MARIHKNEFLSREEIGMKHSKVRFVQVFNRAVADALIKKKWFYVYEEVPHYRTGKMTKCWQFEMSAWDEIKKIEAELKAKAKKKRADKK